VGTAGLLLLACWVPFLALCAYSYPALDDFREASWTSFWDVQRIRYVTYTGRFTGSLIQALNPLHWHSLSAYRWSAVLRLLVLLAAIHALIRTVQRHYLGGTRGDILILEALFSISLLSGLPAPAEFFFWYSASVIYLLPLAILLFSVSLLIHANHSDDRVVRCRCTAASAVGLAWVAGSVEMLPILVIGLGAPAQLVSAMRRNKPSSMLAVAVLVTTVGLSTNLLAPGNRGREIQMKTAQRSASPLAFVWSVEHLLARYMGRWCRTRTIVLPAILSGVLFRHMGCRGLLPLSPALVAVAVAYSIFLLLAGPLWGLGFMVGRVENVCFFAFVLGLYLFVACSVARVEDLACRRHGARHILAGLAISSVIELQFEGGRESPNSIARAYGEWSTGLAAAYESAETTRVEEVRAQAAADAVVQPLDAISRSLVPSVIRLRSGREDTLAERPEQWWGNNNYAHYLGKRTLRVLVGPGG